MKNDNYNRNHPRRRKAITHLCLVTGALVASAMFWNVRRAQAAVTASDPANPQAVKAEIEKLRSPQLKERSDAVMKLRYLGMRGEAAAAIPHLIAMMGSTNEFPQMVLWVSSLSSLTKSCSGEHTFGGEAAETLVRIGQPSDNILALLKSRDSQTRANAIRALGGLKDGRATADLMAILENPQEQWQVRGNAALALGLIGDPQAAASLVAALKDNHAAVRASAAEALGRIAPPQALEPLLQALLDSEPRVRQEAVASLGRLGGAQAMAALTRALEDQDRQVREVAASALRNTSDPRAVRALIQALHDDYANVRINAATTLGERRKSEAVEPLISLLSDKEAAVRGAAAAALGNLKDDRARAALITMVRAEKDEILLARGLEALAKSGHRGAVVALKEYRIHRPDWTEWWRQNQARLLRQADSEEPDRPSPKAH